ncbi:hypothetical protein A2866_00530 [Candidatus Roizmanbacteria bacterium RIFCSPHIGHO2_01_FULL_39_8]|uniref:Uncharacterized protein n=2 Tax=Candidatus Roizmaniibacteriota TaxID=1752723 RepID=A0A1F7GG17_9BACT|nr:MAG: hypothetical protein A2866_00530 [Candidatus Roizmanbacteria bacterium RIFCSPHIGHO2_01_FULL_39_8]OGK28152.1 MAG: hypothetical protein A3C28_05640 [Candidatus Roizmanbacteria bacterium RIFCSPHIGHO2_02_FULL_39_9]
MVNFLFTQTPLAFFIQPFWRDEAFSYVLANKSFFEILFYTARDFNPPFYYIVLHFWMKMFSTSEIAIRSLSLLFFPLTLYICFDFLKDIFKLKTAKSLAYLFIFLINPLLLYFAFEARMYTMFAFFALLSYYSYYLGKPKLYLASVILGLYTHYFMVFVLLSQLAFYFITGKKKRDRMLLRYVYIVFIFYLPWMLYVFFQGQFFATSFWIERLKIKTLVNLPSVLYLGFEQGTGYFTKELQLLTILFGIMFIVTVVKVKREVDERRKLFLFLIVWSIGSAFFIGLISFVKPIFIPRYLIFSSIGFIFLTIFMLEELPIRIRWVLLIILVFFTFSFLRLQIVKRKKSDIRKTVQEITGRAGKNDLVYVTDELDYFTIQYYFDESRVYVFNKNYEEIPQFVGKTLIPKERVATSLPSYPKRAFILNRNGSYVIQSLD